MQVTVTGASGLLGGNLAVELLRQGHRVRATKRPGSRVAHLRAHDIEWVEADLGDSGALAAAFEGSARVFHCAGVVTIRGTPSAAIVETNVGGTERVIEAAREVCVPRLVHCSSTATIGLSDDGRPCTEESRWNFREHGVADAYAETKKEAEERVLAASARGLDAVIVNPPILFGAYDPRPSSGRLLLDVVKGRIPGWFPGRCNFVGARDVARGMILAAERGERGERYILGGQDLPYRELFALIASLAGVSPPRRRIPYPLALLVGLAGDLEERLLDREPLLNSVTVRYGFSEAFLFSSAKAESRLGYRAAPLAEAIEEALRWFEAEGML